VREFAHGKFSEEFCDAASLHRELREPKSLKIAGAELSIMRPTWISVKSMDARQAAVGASNEI
jgi:hypothetical protein